LIFKLLLVSVEGVSPDRVTVVDGSHPMRPPQPGERTALHSGREGARSECRFGNFERGSHWAVASDDTIRFPSVFCPVQGGSLRKRDYADLEPTAPLSNDGAPKSSVQGYNIPEVVLQKLKSTA